jgi:hypothetical protein
MSMFSSVARLARSQHGRRLMNQAVRYAQSPKGKKQIGSARERLASRRGRPRP